MRGLVWHPWRSSSTRLRCSQTSKWEVVLKCTLDPRNPLSTPRTHLPPGGQSQPSIQCAVYESHATTTRQRTPGTQRWDWGPCVSQLLEKINKSPRGELTWFAPDRYGSKGIPPLSRSVVLLPCYTSNQIIISCKSASSPIICHVCSAACAENPAESPAAVLCCEVEQQQNPQRLKNIQWNISSSWKISAVSVWNQSIYSSLCGCSDCCLCSACFGFG